MIPYTTTHLLSHIFYGWRTMGLVSAIRIVGGGLYQYGVAVFFLPIRSQRDQK
jgi:hypothetical protein